MQTGGQNQRHFDNLKVIIISDCKTILNSTELVLNHSKELETTQNCLRYELVSAKNPRVLKLKTNCLKDLPQSLLVVVSHIGKIKLYHM